MLDNYDIIYFTFSSVAIPYVPILKHVQSKIVFSCRGSAEKVIPSFVPNRSKELRKLGEAADLIHCVSNDLFEQIQEYGINKNKCFVNFPSIDTDFFTKSKNSALKSLKHILPFQQLEDFIGLKIFSFVLILSIH